MYNKWLRRNNRELKVVYKDAVIIITIVKTWRIRKVGYVIRRENGSWLREV